VVFPGGWPQLTVPGSVTDLTFGMRLAGTVAGRGSGGGPPVMARAAPGPWSCTGIRYMWALYVDNAYPAEAAPPPQQPDTTVIDPPQPAPAIVERFGSDDARDPATPYRRR